MDKHHLKLSACFAIIIFLIPGALLASSEKHGSVDVSMRPLFIVFDLDPEDKVPVSLGKKLTETILETVKRVKTYQVISEKQLEKIINPLDMVYLPSCYDVGCYIQIAKTTGAHFIMSGSIRTVAGVNALILSITDVRQLKNLGKYEEPLPSDEKQMIAATVAAVGNLLVSAGMGKDIDYMESELSAGGKTNAGGIAKITEYPANPFKIAGHVTFWTGLASAALGGVFSYLSYNAVENYKSATKPGDFDYYQGQSEMYNKLAVSFYSAGGALAATGIILWIVSPGDEEWWIRHHKFVLSPTVGKDNMGMAFQGEW